ncbi:hypothetical protein AN958_12337 [Leucoagaricus sp. SymC.cos]|nr:hypothetical protein AN958_12337 [Leucoagaricus sp. SymC.cos]
MPKVFVVNRSGSPVDCFISKYTNDSGDDSWFTLPVGAGDTWGRGSGWELVTFRRPNSGNNPPRAGVYIHIEDGKTVEFYDFNDIVVH